MRQGALRFRMMPDGPFVAPLDPESGRGGDAPPIVSLPELLEAANALTEDADSVATDDAVHLLLAPGSSLGGARPKASVRDRDGSLAIAKFPDASDNVDVIRWESVMLNLAARAGITVPESRLELVGDSAVLIVRRFDRRGDERIPFLSAMSLLDAADGDPRSYVEIFDALRRIGSEPKADGAQLWRRLAFNILASNFDDHLRNHAVVYDGVAWRLSPAYDLNPVPSVVKQRELSTAISLDGDPAASIGLAVAAAHEFFLTDEDARGIALEVESGVREWRSTAQQCGVVRGEIERMASAFEHEDARTVRSWC